MSVQIGAGSPEWIAARCSRLGRGAILVAGLNPSGAAWARRQARPGDLERLARDPGSAILCLRGGSAETEALCVHAAKALPRGSREALTFVIPRLDPPTDGTRVDGPVRSFVCNAAFYRAVHQRLFADNRAAYRAARAVLARRGRPVALSAIQWPARPPSAGAARTDARADDEPVTWLIPHRGEPAYLEAALQQVQVAGTPRDQVWVCFDEPAAPAHGALVRAHPGVHFWRSVPSGLGPYVARHLLGRAASTDLLMFQDSDDLPMRTRRAELVAELRRSGADLVGSHELRVADPRQEVIAVRFPSDVSGALAEAASHPQFHPTTVVRVAALRRAGGFSTLRTFGADLQFLLRAHFSMRIRNVDAFLYLRWKRPGTLTTSPGTGLGEPDRVALAQQWIGDFERVKRGERTLQHSSLAAVHLPDLHKVRLEYLGSGVAPTASPAKRPKGDPR